jgi:hypothetical protein
VTNATIKRFIEEHLRLVKPETPEEIYVSSNELLRMCKTYNTWKQVEGYQSVKIEPSPDHNERERRRRLGLEWIKKIQEEIKS